MALVVAFSSCDTGGTKADNSFDVSVSTPAFATNSPKVMFDEAHNNAHSIDAKFRPFASLLANDGHRITATHRQITLELLAETDIFVIVAAKGEKDPGDSSPYSVDEIAELEKWVRGGGSALIVTEHYPFGIAMRPLLEAFGVTVHNGYTEDSLLRNPTEPDALLFEKSKGNINQSHPICEGIERVNTFTGTSVRGDSTYAALLPLSAHSQNYDVIVKMTQDGGDVITNVEYGDFSSAAGYSQAICKDYGSGKIAVLAEAAMLTAQIDKNGRRFGMNIPNTDNKQFTLNLFRWLAE